MNLLERFHEEYESDDSPIHAHCEKHRGYTRWNIQIPLTKTSMADFDALMELTEVLRVEGTSEISLSEVEGL